MTALTNMLPAKTTQPKGVATDNSYAPVGERTNYRNTPPITTA
jgi:hypothetical protein